MPVMVRTAAFDLASVKIGTASFCIGSVLYCNGGVAYSSSSLRRSGALKRNECNESHSNSMTFMVVPMEYKLNVRT